MVPAPVLGGVVVMGAGLWEDGRCPVSVGGVREAIQIKQISYGILPQTPLIFISYGTGGTHLIVVT